MRIEFGELKLCEQGTVVDPLTAGKHVPIETLESDISFYNSANDLVFSEVDFDVVILYRELRAWLEKETLKDFIFRGDQIGWLLDLHFKVLPGMINFVVKDEGRELIRIGIPREELMDAVRDFCSKLNAAVEDRYGILL